MDSLVIAGQIELLGDEDGVPSQIPLCDGAVFRLAPGYDMGAPQPVVDLLAAGLLDGERPVGRRSGNRTVSLNVKITAPDRATLTAAREVLLMLVDQDTWQLAWTRDGADSPMILDCFRAAPAVGANDLFAEQELVAYITVSFPALPYGRTDAAEQIVFPAPSQIWDAPAATVAIDSFGTTVNFLQGDQSTFEGGLAQWEPAVTAPNCTVARSTAQAFSGTASMLQTAVAAANMTAHHCPAGDPSVMTYGVRVLPGRIVTVSGRSRAVSTGRSASIGVEYYDDFGAIVGAPSLGSTVANSSAAWVQPTASLTVPSGVSWAVVATRITGPAAGEGHYWDDISIDTGPVYSVIDNNQWSSSTVTPVSGLKSAKWARTAKDYPSYDHTLPAPVDITGRAKMTLWLGLATTATQYGHWRKGIVHVKVTLWDSSGARVSTSQRPFCRASAIDSAPHWQRVGLHIPQINVGFDYSTVSRYRVEVWNTWNSSLLPPGATSRGQPVLNAGAYLAQLQATATGIGSAVTRGLFAEIPGPVGAARAPLAIQIQPGPSSFSTVTEFNTAGSNAWTAPGGVTKVDKAEAWGAGGGGAGRGSNVYHSGGGGGGGGEYSAEYNVPVVAGNSYPAVVGAAGAGGADQAQGAAGGDSYWSGSSGPQVRANGGYGGWKSGAWGGGKGGTGSTNAQRYPGGNGLQSTPNQYIGGGGGGGSGGTGQAGKDAPAAGILSDPSGNTLAGADAVTGGGPGGVGGTGHGTSGNQNGKVPSRGPGGGGGGGGGDNLAATGAAGRPGRVRLTYGASGILPIASVLVHAPSQAAPPSYQAICPVGSGSDTPNGSTEYVVPPPAGVSLLARFDGTYVIYAIASSWNSPSASRTVTVVVKQYPYSGGPAATVSLSRTLVPNTDVTNGYVDLGGASLPINALPAGNVSAEFRVTMQSTNTADRFTDVLILDAEGQTLLWSQPGSSVVQNIWIDPPDSDRALGLVSGSNTDRDQAFSLSQYIERYGGGPLSVDPAKVNRLLVYSSQGAPGFTASYMPSWFMDRVADR